MFGGRLTHAALRFLDGAWASSLPREKIAGHRDVGQRGELDAYFFLRKRGYIMVAQNFRSPRRRGEIDLIGWSGDTLCFIEVKTRRSQGAEPAESAVDKKKRKDVVAVAREFLRNLPPACAWRFDLVTVYYDGAKGAPRFELFTDVLPL
jgi:putative endonuclease